MIYSNHMTDRLLQCNAWKVLGWNRKCHRAHTLAWSKGSHWIQWSRGSVSPSHLKPTGEELGGLKPVLIAKMNDIGWLNKVYHGWNLILGGISRLEFRLPKFQPAEITRPKLQSCENRSNVGTSVRVKFQPFENRSTNGNPFEVKLQPLEIRSRGKSALRKSFACWKIRSREIPAGARSAPLAMDFFLMSGFRLYFSGFLHRILNCVYVFRPETIFGCVAVD